MTQLYEWRGNECESEVQAAVQHASPLRWRTCIRPALAPPAPTPSPALVRILSVIFISSRFLHLFLLYLSMYFLYFKIFIQSINSSSFRYYHSSLSEHYIGTTLLFAAAAGGGDASQLRRQQYRISSVAR